MVGLIDISIPVHSSSLLIVFSILQKRKEAGKVDKKSLF